MCWSPNWRDISCACARGLFILGWVCLVVLPSRAAADCLEAGKVLADFAVEVSAMNPTAIAAPALAPSILVELYAMP